MKPKPSLCDHPDHPVYANKQYLMGNLYWHSKKLYAPSLFKVDDEWGFWACDTCVDRDFEKFNSSRKLGQL